MLKLIKHDLNNTKKTMFTLFSIIFAVCLFSPLFNLIYIARADNYVINIFFNLFLMIVILLIFALAFVVLSNVFKYIEKSLFSKRGYLTFTLPYKTSQIILSKIITAIIWFVSFEIVVTISLLLLILENQALLSAFTGDYSFFTIFNEFWHYIAEIFDFLYDGFWSKLLLIVNSITTLPLLLIGYLFSCSLCNSCHIKTNKKNTASLILIGIIFVYFFVNNLIRTSLGYANDEFTTYVYDPTLYYAINSVINIGLIIGGYFLTLHIIEHDLELV